MLYAKTKNILYVQQQLGHRCIENTLMYTQLLTFEGSEYQTLYPTTHEEEDRCLKADFEFVRYDEKLECPIYRKRL